LGNPSGCTASGRAASAHRSPATACWCGTASRYRSRTGSPWRSPSIPSQRWARTSSVPCCQCP